MLMHVAYSSANCELSKCDTADARCSAVTDALLAFSFTILAASNERDDFLRAARAARSAASSLASSGAMGDAGDACFSARPELKRRFFSIFAGGVASLAIIFDEVLLVG